MSVVTEKISELPEREQLVMQLYYVEELNLKEIGEILGVTESRVSQILSTVVKKLRGELQIEMPGKAKVKQFHTFVSRDTQIVPFRIPVVKVECVLQSMQDCGCLSHKIRIVLCLGQRVSGCIVLIFARTIYKACHKINRIATSCDPV